MAAIRERGLRLGFLKPVGQRYLVVDGTRADEDAVLMGEVFDLPDALNDMSPVTLPRHFTTDFIMGRIDDDLGAQVSAADARVAAGKDVVVIEGTGHAGVGAVIGLSNARVGGHARRAGDHRVAREASGGRSTRSCSTAPCSPPTACGCSGRWSTRWTSSRIRSCPRCSSGGSRSTGSTCSAASRTPSSWPTRRSS